MPANMFKMKQWFWILVTLIMLPFSEVAVLNRFIKKEIEEVNTSNYEEPDHLESHEAMQQESTNGWINSPHEIQQQKQNTFINGRLEMEDQEPHMSEHVFLTDLTPTEAMDRNVRNTPVKEPEPNGSEALLELLVTIASQPERWKHLIEYINAVLNSPMVHRLSHKNILKSFIQNSESASSDIQNLNHNYHDNIQHMIIFLKNNNIQPKEGWPNLDVEKGIKKDKKSEILDNISMNVSNGATTLPADTQIEMEQVEDKHKTSQEITDPSFKVYNSYFETNNNDNEPKSTIEQQKFIDELHRLGSLTKEKYNGHIFEEKYNLPHDSRLYLKRINKYDKSNVGYYNDTVPQTNEKYNDSDRNDVAWPDFDQDYKYTDINEKNFSDKPTTMKPKTTTAKPKEWFSFRRVTNSPTSGLEKTRARNAYIAVSVIAPTMRKFYRSSNKMDVDSIERELIQLKPWNHHDNLSHMKKLRAKWPNINRDMNLN